MPDEVAGMGGSCEAASGVLMRVSRSPHVPVRVFLLDERQEWSSLRIRLFNNYFDLW